MKIRRNWEDILRITASIYTGTVRVYDVVTMLQALTPATVPLS